MNEEDAMRDHDRYDEQELIAGARAGREDAWRALYDATCQPLFNFLCYQAGDRDVARDLLQETYVTAMRSLDGYRGDGSVVAWLRTIALRKCLDWRRRAALRVRKLTELARDLPSPFLRPAEPASAALGDSFEAALAGLSPKQRAALLLRELEDLSFAEVARELGCNEATARVHHHRACRAMRRLLGGDASLVPGGTTGGTL